MIPSLMTPQLFCEADTRALGECPCVKCRKVMDAAKKWRETYDKYLNGIIVDILSANDQN